MSTASVAEAKQKIEELRQRLDHRMSGPVVSLAEVREIKRLLLYAGIDQHLAETWAVFRKLVRACFGLEARILLDRVQHCCEAEGLSLSRAATTPAELEAVQRVVDGLGYCTVFTRHNRRVRRLYCEAHGLPWVSVCAHLRAGIRVSGYERYIGTPHHDALPVADYPPVVGQVVQRLPRS